MQLFDHEAVGLLDDVEHDGKGHTRQHGLWDRDQDRHCERRHDDCSLDSPGLERRTDVGGTYGPETDDDEQGRERRQRDMSDCAAESDDGDRHDDARHEQRQPRLRSCSDHQPGCRHRAACRHAAEQTRQDAP